MPDECGFAELYGGRIYWEAAGEGEPLVFVHGFTLDSRMWDDQWGVFAPRYRVIRYDCRGFGRSSLPEGPFSHQDDLRGLMDHLGVERFHLVGLSMGGSIAVDYAVTHPGDLLSLVLIDPGGGGRLSRAARIFGSIAKEQGVDAAREAWLNDGLFLPARRDRAVEKRLDEIVGAYSGWHWLAEDIPQIVPQPPARERLHDITAPTLVIVGELDVPRMQETADAYANGIPGARKVVIPNAGHMANMEEPEAVNDALQRFLDAL